MSLCIGESLPESIRNIIECKEKEITEMKKRIEETFKNDITPGLLKNLREVQQKLPENVTEIDKNSILFFRGFGSLYVLTKNCVIDKTHNPYTNKTLEDLLKSYICPNPRVYPKEHNPSVHGAKLLLSKIEEISEHYKMGLNI